MFQTPKEAQAGGGDPFNGRVTCSKGHQCRSRWAVKRGGLNGREVRTAQARHKIQKRAGQMET